MIRYKIATCVKWLNLDSDLTSKNLREVIFDHRKHIYFVDILEVHKNGQQARMRIHMPNGELIEGWQMMWWVMLHHVGNLFDGRFNAA